MTDPAVFALAGLALLLAKHFLCDFVLQTARHVEFKGIYGHPAGIEHSAIHLAGTVPCLWLLGVRLLPLALIAAAEFVIHYHEDWLKEQIVRRNGWTPTDRAFWLALGADQLVHNATYLAMIFVVMTWSGVRG